MVSRKNKLFLRKTRISIVFILFFLILSITTVYGHRMVIDPVENDLVWVGFADNSTLDVIKVQVMDKEGNILQEGNVDQEGYFAFDQSGPAYKLLAEDGMGHRVQWIVGEEAAYSQGWTQYLKMGGIIAGFISVAIFFTLKRRLNK